MARAATPNLVHKAICNGHYGQIEWTDKAQEVMLADRRMQGFRPNGVRDLLRQWVIQHGSNCLRATQETDPDWLAEYPDDPWWYSVVIDVKGFYDGLFVKVKLIDPDDTSDPWVVIISCHPEIR
jgi:hypothetical protein